MNKEIQEFIKSEKVVHISFCTDRRPYAFTSFYVFNSFNQSLVFKSGIGSYHANALVDAPEVAGTVAGQLPFIKGIQFQGIVQKINSTHDAGVEMYHSAYPVSVTTEGSYWILNLNWVKYTDNQLLGFGNKLVWENKLILNR